MHRVTSNQEALDDANLHLGHYSSFSSVTSHFRNSLLKNENICVRNCSTLFVLQNRFCNGWVPETMALSLCYSAKASCRCIVGGSLVKVNNTTSIHIQREVQSLLDQSTLLMKRILLGQYHGAPRLYVCAGKFVLTRPIDSMWRIPWQLIGSRSK